MSVLGDAYQVLSDCPHCLVEAAVLQVMDPLHPACHLGVPVESRCRMCNWLDSAEETEFAARFPMASGRCPACTRPLGEEARSGEGPCPHCGFRPEVRRVRSPEDLTDAGRAEAALERWAVEEGSDSAIAFCEVNIGLPIEEVLARLARREPITTTFDVIAFLFPGGGGGGGGSSSPIEGDVPFGRPIEVVDRAPALPPSAPVADAPTAMDPRTPARVLVSVMVADGTLRPGEQRFITEFLRRRELTHLHPSDLRVWRPGELGTPPPPELAETLLEACVQLMHLDRERDGSEWAVIREYARAWGMSERQLLSWDQSYDRKYAPTMRKLWRSLAKLFR